MKLSAIIFRHEWIMLRRSPFLTISLAMFVLLSGYGIYYGRESIRLQQEKVRVIADSVSVQQVRYRQSEDMPSLIRFNYSFLAVHRPSLLSGLSLGQRDLYPYYYVLNAQSLYVQTLKGDINNPFKLSAGSFDLAFVIVYLLPLLIIAWTFDCLSAERDWGTDALLDTQPVDRRLIVLWKFLYRFLMIGGLVVLISIAGVMVVGFGGVAGLGLSFLWIGVSLLYTAFWFAVVFALISLRRPTAFNAVGGIGIWMGILIVIPALINLVTSAGRPVSATALAGLMRSRSMPESEEMMKKALDAFSLYYPEIGHKDTAGNPWFRFQGYSAFLALNDRRDDRVVDSFYTSLRARSAVVRGLSCINPAVNTQELFNLLAGSSLEDELAFKEAVRDFHREIYWFSNRPLFAGRRMVAADYLRQPVFQSVFQPGAGPRGYGRLLVGGGWLAMSTLALSFLGWRRLSKGVSGRGR